MGFFPPFHMACRLRGVAPYGLPAPGLDPLRGSKVLYCVRYWAPGPPKCCTVYAFGPPGCQSVVLWTVLDPRGPEVLYCARFWAPGRQRAVLCAFLPVRGPKVLYCARFCQPGPPMCCTVRAVAPPGAQSAVLCALLDPQGPKVLSCRAFGGSESAVGVQKWFPGGGAFLGVTKCFSGAPQRCRGVKNALPVPVPGEAVVGPA